MNYIPINELRRLESKGLIEDLTILSNGEVYCRITSSNVAVLSRLANRSDDFEYHQGEYRIHEDARAINCYYVQFKLPVNTGKFNDVKSVTYHERGMKYIVLEDGTMYYGDSKLTHRKMSEDEFNMLYANAYGPRPNVIGRQFHVCPERDYEYLNGTSIHLHRDELKHLKSEGAYDPKRLRDGTAKFPLLEVGLFFHKSESEFRFVRDDDLINFVDTLNRAITWTSFSKDSFRFVRESNIVAGDRRQIWETQTNTGFGVDDYVIPYTVNYAVCPKLGRVAPVTYVPELVLMNHIDSINAKFVDEYDVYLHPLFFRNYHRDGTYDLMPVTRDYVSGSISIFRKGGKRIHKDECLDKGKVRVGSRIRFDSHDIFNCIDTFKFNGILRDSNDIDLSVDVITRTGLNVKVKYDCAGIMVPEFHEGQGVPMEHPTVPDCAARTPSVSEAERVRWVERMSNLMMP